MEEGGSDTKSELSQELAAGDYTIEATTYNPNEGGDFTLTVQMERTATPTPTPTSTPVPPPPPPAQDITEAACNADDLSHLGDYEFYADSGPFTYRSNYNGIVQDYIVRYEATTSDVAIVCIATRYNSVDNARWHGLNYSTALNEFGELVDGNINNHEQAFIASWIGYDMLGLHVDYMSGGGGEKINRCEVHRRAEPDGNISPLHTPPAQTNIPDIEGPVSVASSIADRVFSAASENSRGGRAFDAAEALR